ncbi:MAG: ANTAR domain-containing protein [Butyrivibrio sp.]|uniref:ANTAR domain-containing response regulator n=1 Tax=Butyrivibrio sp. TaxID=28121 RepID=UPI001B044D89|nr:ANTAR domain-containing protein [Butyrivibrio sp.]MBO6240024.1 ANTAR domain-containing protein [Butyrivibrio sp.]
MNIIVAFSRAEDAQHIKSILLRGGYDNVIVCTTGVKALSAMEDLGSGVIVCGYRLNDMLFSELAQDLPGYFQMLMIASADKAPFDKYGEKLVFLPSPFSKADFYSTINMMLEGVTLSRKKAKQKRLHKSEADMKTITKAKELLMERHHMSEPEAHKYLQKCAMNSGTTMLEAAEMVISLNSV